MASVISRNEVVAAKRRALMTINALDGVTPLWRGASFVGRLFVGRSQASLVAGAGTLTNVRKPIVVADMTVTATDQANDRVTIAGHGRQTGDGPFRPTTTAGGFVAGADYWAIKHNDDLLSWAAGSPTNAYLGTKVDITADVTGMVFQDVVGVTERGRDGLFVLELTQAETDIEGSELYAIVEDEARVIVANAGTDEFTLNDHELRTGQVIFLANVGGGLPGNTIAVNPYWVIRAGANTFKVAATFADALTGTAIDLSSAGTGTHYVESPMTRAVTSCNLGTITPADVWNYIIEAGHSAARLFRGIARQNLAKRNKVGNVETTRDLADTKDSHHGTVTPAGRDAVIDDLS